MRGFLSTNELLRLQRSDGYVAGRSARVGSRTPRSKYNEYVQMVRDLVAIKARRMMRDAKVERLGASQVDMFWMLFPAWDADAGVLSGKAVIDGLVDAGVWGNDRRAITRLSHEVEREWVGSPVAMDLAGVKVEQGVWVEFFDSGEGRVDTA
jgi:hypothetical protein